MFTSKHIHSHVVTTIGVGTTCGVNHTYVHAGSYDKCQECKNFPVGPYIRRVSEILVTRLHWGRVAFCIGGVMTLAIAVVSRLLK